VLLEAKGELLKRAGTVRGIGTTGRHACQRCDSTAPSWVWGCVWMSHESGRQHAHEY
jgi:hypothetical protein